MLPLLLAAPACDKKEEDKPAVTKPASKKLSDKDLDKADVPVKEQFEMKARSTINETNVEKQLDALEKEITEDTK
jgi:hypothetical protein